MLAHHTCAKEQTSASAAAAVITVNPSSRQDQARKALLVGINEFFFLIMLMRTPTCRHRHRLAHKLHALCASSFFFFCSFVLRPSTALSKRRSILLNVVLIKHELEI
jgi:hypothetical protein